ncbi:unnamed protein product [Dibothriocephalus latus]|uniref:Uncharacterized protein n=1 Tax=Dibothriocephalus latus TaxID=60516 RepID=A0A3P7NQN9_DIBLA|nr:unnamed protein product [Dibothriocephalus latus]
MTKCIPLTFSLTAPSYARPCWRKSTFSWVPRTAIFTHLTRNRSRS